MAEERERLTQLLDCTEWCCCRLKDSESESILKTPVILSRPNPERTLFGRSGAETTFPLWYDDGSPVRVDPFREAVPEVERLCVREEVLCPGFVFRFERLAFRLGDDGRGLCRRLTVCSDRLALLFGRRRGCERWWRRRVCFVGRGSCERQVLQVVEVSEGSPGRFDGGSSALPLRVECLVSAEGLSGMSRRRGGVEALSPAERIRLLRHGVRAIL